MREPDCTLYAHIHGSKEFREQEVSWRAPDPGTGPASYGAV